MTSANLRKKKQTSKESPVFFTYRHATHIYPLLVSKINVLLVADGFDGVHVGGFLGWEIAEADADDGADGERDDDAPQGDAGGQGEEVADVGACQAASRQQFFGYSRIYDYACGCVFVP